MLNDEQLQACESTDQSQDYYISRRTVMQEMYCLIKAPKQSAVCITASY